MNKGRLTIFLVLVLMGTLNIASKFLVVKATETIYIRADGSIDPPTANITRVNDFTYTFFGDNYASLRIERSNIIINGSDFKLQGFGGGTGLYLGQISNVTIVNLEIDNFGYAGIYSDICSNIKVSRVIVTNNDRGVEFYNTPNSSISQSHIARNDYGIMISRCYNIQISNNNLTGNYPYGYGASWSIWLSNSFNVTVYKNSITDNYNGIMIGTSNNTQVTENNITSNVETGILIFGSLEAVLSNNLLNDNQYGFGVEGWEFQHFMHTIDASNFIDGKPIYYLLNQREVTINYLTHPTVGYLALVNSTNVTVKNLNLTGNLQGLLLAYTNNMQIQNNNILNNYDGIALYSSSNNTLLGNNIAYNYRRGLILEDFSNNNSVCRNNIRENTGSGLQLEDSFGNFVSGNNITSNHEHGILIDTSSDNKFAQNNIKNNYEDGVHFSDSSNNTVAGNTLINNTLAIAIYSSFNNFIYHNNFIDNTEQIYISDPKYRNFWDNGIEGNYWGNYTGVDSGNDGIGDTPYIINENNTDNKPLMGIFNSFAASAEYYVNVISNSTIDNFEYFDFNHTIKMNISNRETGQTFGFCRLAIRHELIPPPYTIIINGKSIEYNTISENETLSIIYFSYKHSTLNIIIIPEFSSSITFLGFLMLITVFLVFANKKAQQ